jgi:hypothetical protein
MHFKRALELITFIYAFILYAGGPSIVLQTQKVRIASRFRNPSQCSLNAFRVHVADAIF